MQNEQEFYRCLVSDAAGRTLKKILEIIRLRAGDQGAVEHGAAARHRRYAAFAGPAAGHTNADPGACAAVQYKAFTASKGADPRGAPGQQKGRLRLPPRHRPERQAGAAGG